MLFKFNGEVLPILITTTIIPLHVVFQKLFSNSLSGCLLTTHARFYNGRLYDFLGYFGSHHSMHISFDLFVGQVIVDFWKIFEVNPIGMENILEL